MIGHKDFTFPNSLELQGRCHVEAGSTAGINFLKNPACELWDRENDELFRILYHTCKNVVAHRLLQQLRPVNGSGARRNGQETLNSLRNATGTRVDLRRAYVDCLQKMQSCTLQPGEDPDVFFARVYHRRLQLQQVGCTVNGYQLKLNALS